MKPLIEYELLTDGRGDIAIDTDRGEGWNGSTDKKSNK